MLKRFQRTSGTRAAAVCLVGSLAFLAAAATTSPSRLWAAGKHYALLIGVSKYEKVDDLPFTSNDVDRLAEVLRRQGFTRVHTIRDPRPNEKVATAPITAAQLQESLKRFLRGAPNFGFAKPTSEDRVVVFFSGHGVQTGAAAERKLYLCPGTFDAKRPEETGVSISWLRKQMECCKAQSKVLIIDSCHAGSTKAGTPKPFVGFAGASRPAEAAEEFRPAGCQNVITFASCSAKETSLISDELQHSLFTFHVIEALKGHADSNLDGEIDVDEFYAYLFARVPRDAEHRFGRTQRPVREIGLGTVGVPIICRVRPLGLDQLLSDIAHRLAYEVVAQREYAKAEEDAQLSVVPFELTAAHGDLDKIVHRLDTGLLGRYCEKKLQQEMKAAAERMGTRRQPVFDVRDRKWLKNNLSVALDAHSLHDPVSNTRNTLAANSVLLARGVLRTSLSPVNSGQNEVAIQCEVVRADKLRPLAKAGGRARISLEEAAMSGWSGKKLRETTAGPAEVLPDVDNRHPLQDSQFPFPVGVQVDGHVRPAKFVGNQAYVPLAEGEEYKIVVLHRDGQAKRLMRLLVDGQNTLPQHVTVAASGKRKFSQAPLVHLAVARPWLLVPDTGRRFTIPGFFSTTGEVAEGGRFTLAKRAESPLHRTRFEDQIGMITAAFYEVHPAAKEAQVKLATVPGKKVYAEIEEVSDIEFGRQIAFVCLRYVDRETWTKLPAQPVVYMK